MFNKYFKFYIFLIFSAFIFQFALSCGNEGGGDNKSTSSNTNPPAVLSTPPTVLSTNPASNAKDIAISITITAVFSEKMDMGTINTTTFTLKNNLNNSITGIVTYSGTTATFTPSSALGYNTQYTAKITTGVKDSTGSPLAQNYTWSFTTGKAPDVIKKLSFFEEALVGLWSHYHSYDGSTNYIMIDGDRTACDWEEASGSNYRKSKSYFTYWEITTEPTKNHFIVDIKGSGLTSGYTFDYVNDVLYPTNFQNLKYYKDNSGKMCE